MESDDPGPSGETTSFSEASCPIEGASQTMSEAQEALGNGAEASWAATGIATEGESMLMTGEALEAAVMEIVALGYTKDQAVLALAASCNNPNRAVEYLLSGEHGMTSETAKLTSQSRGEISFPCIVEDASSEAGDPLMIFASQPQFSQVRQMLGSNPQLLNTFLQQVRRTNPRLHKAISENRDRFLQTLNEPIVADGGLGNLDGGGGGAAASILLSQAEHQAVERLMALGFSQSLCVQAYFACEKNENLAAEFLLLQDPDEPS